MTFEKHDRPYKTKEGELVYSKGELEIADFLHDHEISYFYEMEVRLGRRKWYPDFYLPDFKVYVEYQGMKEEASSQKRYGVKFIEFKIHNKAVIYLYPNQIGKLGKTLLNELEKIEREA